jgi:hypothetical protein
MIRADDEVVYWQSFQQLIMGLEVARQGGEISDDTYMKMIRKFLPMMKPSTQERKDAEKTRPMIDPVLAQQNGNSRGVPALAAGPQGNNE